MNLCYAYVWKWSIIGRACNYRHVRESHVDVKSIIEPHLWKDESLILIEPACGELSIAVTFLVTYFCVRHFARAFEFGMSRRQLPKGLTDLNNTGTLYKC